MGFFCVFDDDVDERFFSVDAGDDPIREAAAEDARCEDEGQDHYCHW